MDASITPQQLISLCQQAATPHIIDVRREPVFKTAPDLIASAVWRNPATVNDWAGDIANNDSVIVYCVHGHEVSQKAANVLRERGLRAQFLEGGIEAWRTAGGELTANTSRSSQESP